MPRSIVVLCVLLGALLWAGPAQAARSPQPPRGQLPLVAVRAESGSLKRVGRARFVLTLRDVAREGDIGSDPLERDAAGAPLRTFFAGWRALGFRADPPDAVVALSDGSNAADALAVELGVPRYDARRGILRIPVRALRGVPDGLERFGADLDKAIPTRFDDVALLIDDTVVPTAGRGSCGYMGQLVLFPRGTPRSDSYFAANGQLLPVQRFLALFAMMEDRFGGDGRVAFAMPRLGAPAGLRWELCAAGYWPPRADGEDDRAICTTGAISLQAQTWRTGGWLPADGRSLDPARWRQLTAAIGTAFGGDGRDTFALPRIPDHGGMTWYICANGDSFTPQGPTLEACALSELALYGTNGVPSNFLPADGRTLKITDNRELFSLIGNAFGGDGVSTFALPNLPGPVAGTSYGICSYGVWPT